VLEKVVSSAVPSILDYEGEGGRSETIGSECLMGVR